MLFRGFLLLTGFGIAVTGGISMIVYLNLLTTGNGVFDYIIFILKRIECYLLPLGMLICWISIYFPDFKKMCDK